MPYKVWCNRLNSMQKDLLSSPEMFRVGADAAGLAGNCSPRYVCPLCMRSYETYDPKVLSREHVPAESLGGRALLLTCRHCNNVAGLRLQGHQVERERQEAFWRGDRAGTLNLEIHADGGTIRGEVETSGETRRFFIHSSRTAPDALENWPHLEQKTTAYTLGRRFEWKASRVADLRDAYLWAFAQYGYSLIAVSSYDWVRKAIQEGSHSNTKWAIHLDDSFTSEQQRIHKGPVLLVTSNPEGALVVANGLRGTILPTLHCPNPYAQLEEKVATLEFLPRAIPVPRELHLFWDYLPRKRS